MRLKTLCASWLCVGVLVVDPKTAAAQTINLDALSISSATPSGASNVNVFLGPGTYLTSRHSVMR